MLVASESSGLRSWSLPEGEVNVTRDMMDTVYVRRWRDDTAVQYGLGFDVG